MSQASTVVGPKRVDESNSRVYFRSVELTSGKREVVSRKYQKIAALIRSAGIEGISPEYRTVKLDNNGH